MPQSIAISNTLGQATNTYMYAADGRKLRTVQQWSGTNSKQTDYVGNVIYESVNGTATTLKRILVDGGYIEGGVYYFYLTDHLGNNRVVANASGGIVQKNHYYPFGMSFAEGVTASGQPYKYNGKELDTERGLNLYDYGARFYDPQIGRWHSVDPLAEKSRRWSPYNSCYNNPLILIDLDGLRPIWNGKYRDECEYYDDDTHKEVSWNQVQNYINYGNYDGPKELENSNDESSHTITPFRVGEEWLSGKGERNRVFVGGDYFTELLKNMTTYHQLKK